MMRWLFLVLLCAGALPLLAQDPAVTPPLTPDPVAAVPSGSLWQDGHGASLFTRRPFQVGDLILVDILQQSSLSTTARHNTAKSIEAKVDPGTAWTEGLKGFSLKAARSTAGSGNAAASTTVLDTLSVTVTAILPNGNLHIEGNRAMTFEADSLQLHFSGDVRPQDIGLDNTVPSSLVANARLEAKGQGPIAEKSRPGLIARLLHFLW
jgi:flagellar L-ring protein precursor FlgH